MIVQMKKISVVVEDGEIRRALDALADAGILHPEHHAVPKGDELDHLREEHGQMSEVVSVLAQINPRSAQELCPHVKQMFINVFTALKEIRDAVRDIHDLQTMIARWEPWGAFDPHEIRALEKRGIHAKLYVIPQEQMDSLPPELTVETVFSADGTARVIVFSQEPINLDVDEIPLPEIGLNQMISLKEKAVLQKEELERFIRESAKYLAEFQERLKRVEDRIAYQEALAGRGLEEGFSVITGYCPVDQGRVFEERARRERWAYLMDDPSADDHPPTLLRNPKWVELIKPVFSMINVLPGYREYDISVVFLIFFSLFFGILIGDAGYGLIFALLTGLAHWKIGPKLQDRTPLWLMYLLSGMTVVWGILTGTFLGQALLPGMRPLVPWLSDYDNVQRLCFFIGALHLSIAHLWRGILKWPSVSVLSEAGWLCLLWGMFFLARVLVLGEEMAPGAVYLFMIGPALVAFFTKPNWNPFKALAGGLGDLVLNIVNTFTDIVSYIRLFAVGLATVAVADAFNVMALELGFNNIAAGFLAALILVLGHVFNMILGAMAILVHGLRLNVLEFSSHMNLEWAGVKYQPLKKDTKAL